MLRKGGSVTSINTSGTGPGIGTGTTGGGPAITGLSSSSNSSPLHYHSSSRLHHAHRRPRGESLGEAQQRSQYRTSSPSSSSTLEGALHHHHQQQHHRLPTNTLPKRGPALSSSASDISGGSVFSGGCGGGCVRSPSRQQQQQQHHCCGCACANPPPPPPPNKGSISNNTLLRHVVSSNLSSSPTRASSPLLLSSSSPNHNHSPLLLRGDQRDCPVDSHPRLTTATTHNPNNHLSRQQLWHFGKEDEIDDEEDCGGVGAVGGQIICEHERLLRVEEESVGRRVSCGGSTSHGYHPSPVLTLPCQGASAHYNAGAITSTPTTSNAGGFAFFKLQNSSSTSVPSPPELLLPMDFIQVLIHQHAKTIVALQDLQREVSTLKDFRTSLLHSLPATGAPTAPTGLSDAVWTTGGGSAVGGSSPPTATPTSSSSGGGGAPPAASSTTKIPHPDSGFSTETKSTNQKSDAESDDELYSLLSLIQCKVQESIIRNDYLLSSHQNRTATSSHRSSSNRKSGDSTKPKERLGKLDKVLGNCDKVEFRKDFISRDVIRGVLGAEKTELQRQLFFALVKIENLKSVTKEQKTVDSRVYALSQENEQLRYKLKEMEIELEGTKATLRILQKNSYSPSPANAPLSSKSSSSSSTVLPEASGHNNHPHHHQSRLIVVPPPPHHPAWESDSLDNTDPAEFAIPGTTAVSALPAVGGPSPAAASTATRQRLIQKLSDIESISSSNSSPASAATNNNSRLSNYPYGSSSNNSNSSSSGSGSKKSPAPKPPVIVEHVPTTTTTSGTAPPSTANNTKQQKSASPVGNKSMSSIKSNNSSIPIAVSRLKGKTAAPANNVSSPPNNNNNNNNNKVVAGKGKSGAAGGGSSTTGSTGGNGGIGTIWANWFS